MPELDPRHDGDQDGDEEYLADAYAALDEDQHRQDAESAAETSDVDVDSATAGTGGVEKTAQPTTAAAVPANSGVQSAEPTATDATAGPSVGPNRRVFLIDNKEYPDPDPELPITGTRSVQAMYRDYFPGQLDNVDVAEKTRPDGTLEVTFKRRIGTKGVGVHAKRRRQASGSGEVVITQSSVVNVLASLLQDRPLVWDLVEQAVDSTGTVRLDYVPPAAQLNLAEAQQAARVRLIELAVSELRRLRPYA